MNILSAVKNSNIQSLCLHIPYGFLVVPSGWGGKGLGAGEQGIVNPVEAAEVRDRTDMYKGIGNDLKDPFEQFRKNKSQGFIQRMKTRDEEKRE